MTQKEEAVSGKLSFRNCGPWNRMGFYPQDQGKRLKDFKRGREVRYALISCKGELVQAYAMRRMDSETGRKSAGASVRRRNRGKISHPSPGTHY